MIQQTPKDRSVNPDRKPIPVTAADMAFGGKCAEILPPMAEIPTEFLGHSGVWLDWQNEWFMRGLKRYPVAKAGIDLNLAMNNLQCVQGSYAPKHEHKQAGVAYLASLWFEQPDGELIQPA